MKLLIFGDAGCHSGFATVTHEIGERLVRDYGHDVSVLAITYQGDHWDTPLKLYPAANQGDPLDITGMRRQIKLVAEIMPDAILYINDPAVVMNSLLANPWDPEQVLWRGMKTGEFLYKPPILAYLPIDGYDSPRMWDILTQRVRRIAMSHFGQAAMPEAPVIWHGVDTAVFHPRDKRESKRALGFDPDRILVLRVDRNSIRKDYPATWKALRPILRRHPEVDVHFHCQPVAPDGYNLNALMFNDEDIRDRVTFSANLGGFTGMTTERLATLYSAADLFVSSAWGEGFGLGLLEAMAAGTPVLAQDCSAITEVVGPGGILVKPRGRTSTPMGQDQCLPDIEKFTYWIEHLVSARQMRERLGEAAAAHAAQFSWDTAARMFNDQLIAAVSPTP